MPLRILVVGAGAIGAFFGSRLSSVAAVSALCKSNYQVVKTNGFNITSPIYALPDVKDDGVLLDGLVELPYHSRFNNATSLSAVTIVSVAQSTPASTSKAGDNLATERATRLVNLMLEAGVKDATRLNHADLQFLRWRKVAINAALSSTAVLSGGADNLTMSTDRDLSQHLLGVMKEVLEMAPEVLGRPLPPHLPTPEAVFKSIARSRPRLRPSMLFDWEQSRHMELEVIPGNPIGLAREVGVDMPRLQTVYALLKMAQATRQKKSTSRL